MGEKMTEREAFEKWAREKQWPVFRCDYLNDLKYEDTFVTTAWQAWQARAHITQPAQAVDVGAIRAVIAWLRRQEGMRVDPDHVAEALTAALPKDSNGAEGV